MKQETNENKQEDNVEEIEKNDSIPEWLHERVEALARGMFRNDRDFRDNGKG